MCFVVVDVDVVVECVVVVYVSVVGDVKWECFVVVDFVLYGFVEVFVGCLGFWLVI